MLHDGLPDGNVRHVPPHLLSLCLQPVELATDLATLALYDIVIFAGTQLIRRSQSHRQSDGMMSGTRR